MLILDNAAGHSKVNDYNTEGEVIFMPLNTIFLIQPPLDQRVIRPFNDHNTGFLMERSLHGMDEDSDKENIENVEKF